MSPTPGNTFSSAHIASLKEFKKVVKQRFDGFDFEDRHSALTEDALMTVQQTFSDIYADIECKEEWVLAFKRQFSDKHAKARKVLEGSWRDARKEMFTALDAYPRNVSEVASPTGLTNDSVTPAVGRASSPNPPLRSRMKP